MKIVKLTAENIKRLKAVEITPTGALVEVTGKNGQGKSSVLDAIWWALAGAEHIQTVPIRRGEEKARIRLDLGDLIVERKFTAAGTSLTVTSADGAKYPSPQTMLDKLIGALAFDPLAFVSAEPKKQFETLRKIVPLDVDIDALDRGNAKDYALRADKNRDAKQAQARVAAIVVPAGLPAEKIDTTALTQELADAGRKNTEAVFEDHLRQNLRRDLDYNLTEVARLRNEAARLITSAEQAQARADTIEADIKTLPPCPDQIDVTSIKTKIEEAIVTNSAIERRTRKAEGEMAAKAYAEEADAITARMKDRETAKAAAIAAAKMPVPGLGFGDGVVTFNDVPFDQASSADQIRVSLAIAMASNPKLKVIRIKEGSFLDEDNLALIAKMAEDADYQIWIEKVDSTGKVGVVIEDGMVKLS